MKKVLIFLITILILLLSSCTQGGESIRKLMPSQTDYTDEITTDSPEGLAKKTSDIYIGLVNEEIDISEAFDQLKEISCEESVTAMLQYSEEFEKQINQTIQFFKVNDDTILKYEFAETVYSSDREAYIERIQIQKSGKEYYFKQDFIKEDGVWKIRGDNIANDFILKKKFLFWYV